MSSDDRATADALLAGADSPTFVVTAFAAGERSGCLVGFVTQASIQPLRLIVMLSKTNRTYQVAQRTDTLAVHFLHEDNEALAERFGEQTGDQIDKFAACEYHDGPEHTPILHGTRGWVTGQVLDRFDAGDHVAHLLEVTTAEEDIRGRQLHYHRVRHLQAGHGA